MTRLHSFSFLLLLLSAWLVVAGSSSASSSAEARAWLDRYEAAWSEPCTVELTLEHQMFMPTGAIQGTLIRAGDGRFHAEMGRKMGPAAGRDGSGNVSQRVAFTMREISDGETIWSVIELGAMPDRPQITRRPAQERRRGALVPSSNLISWFDGLVKETVHLGEDGFVVAEETKDRVTLRSALPMDSRTPAAGEAIIELVLDRETALPREIEIEMLRDMVFRVTFDVVRAPTRSELAPANFRYQPPPGVRVKSQ